MSGQYSNPFHFELRPDSMVPIALLLVFTAFELGAGSALAATALFLASLIAHEFSHLVVATILGTEVSAFGFCWKGAYIRRDKAPNPICELLISAAGPLGNVLIAAFALRLGGLGTWLADINLILALMNLLPVRGSDGRRILTAIGDLFTHQSPENLTRRPRTPYIDF